MTVGKTIAYSVPVVGTTIASLTRSSGNNFLKDTYGMGSGSYPAVLSLRPASSQSTRRRFGVSFTVRPDANDDPGTLTLGSCTVSVNIDAKLGSDVTTSTLAAAVRHSVATLLHSNLIEDLSNGVSL